MKHQPLDEHEAHEGLSQADAVAQERTAKLSRDSDEGPVRLLLIPIQAGVDHRLGFVPLSVCDLIAAEKLVEGLCPHVERCVGTSVPFDYGDDVVRHVHRIAPMLVEPFLKLLDVARTLDLNVELDV